MFYITLMHVAHWTMIQNSAHTGGNVLPSAAECETGRQTLQTISLPAEAQAAMNTNSFLLKSKSSHLTIYSAVDLFASIFCPTGQGSETKTIHLQLVSNFTSAMQNRPRCSLPSHTHTAECQMSASICLHQHACSLVTSCRLTFSPLTKCNTFDLDKDRGLRLDSAEPFPLS